MTLSIKLVLLGFITGLLIYIAFPVLEKEATLMGLWMILWSRGLSVYFLKYRCVKLFPHSCHHHSKVVPKKDMDIIFELLDCLRSNKEEQRIDFRI
ncbi:hypothetical protein AC624_12915 [Bacillus sp. FJAT-27238]|nr:hypothetical protein AC624_12915 [Bacillus sp. FJAT-27238]